MKKSLLILGAFIAFGWSSYAGNNYTVSYETMMHQPDGKVKKQKTVDEKADRFVVKVDNAAQLDNTQKSTVRNLAINYFTKQQELAVQHKGDKEKMRAGLINLRKELNEGLKSTLSQEQFEKWKAQEKQNKANRKQKKAENN